MWGKETVIDLSGCDGERITSAASISQYFNDLCDLIDMKQHREPIIEHFGEGDFVGFTAVQLITTSSITAHFAERSNEAYINIFSCKEYDAKAAADFTANYFKADLSRVVVLERG